MCENRAFEWLQDRRSQKIMTMKNPTLHLVKLGADYRFVLKDEKEQVKFEVKNRANAEHFISQHIYGMDDENSVVAGEDLAVKTGLVCLDNQARYFLPTEEWGALKVAGVADKALELADLYLD